MSVPVLGTAFLASRGETALDAGMEAVGITLKLLYGVVPTYYGELSDSSCSYLLSTFGPVCCVPSQPNTPCDVLATRSTRKVSFIIRSAQVGHG